MKIQFMGATETVTGSKYLLQIERRSLLIDCGMFQGFKDSRTRNWESLPINANKIDAVLLSHGR